MKWTHSSFFPVNQRVRLWLQPSPSPRNRKLFLAVLFIPAGEDCWLCRILGAAAGQTSLCNKRSTQKEKAKERGGVCILQCTGVSSSLSDSLADETLSLMTNSLNVWPGGHGHHWCLSHKPFHSCLASCCQCAGCSSSSSWSRHWSHCWTVSKMLHKKINPILHVDFRFALLIKPELRHSVGNS